MNDGWTKTVTIAVLAVAGVVLAGWDIFVATNNVPGDTISELTQGVAYRVRLVPVGLGVIMGHLFVPGAHRRIVPAVVSLSILTAIVGLFDLLWRAPVNPAFAFLVGVPVGWAIWPQPPKDAPK